MATGYSASAITDNTWLKKYEANIDSQVDGNESLADYRAEAYREVKNMVLKSAWLPSPDAVYLAWVNDNTELRPLETFIALRNFYFGKAHKGAAFDRKYELYKERAANEWKTLALSIDDTIDVSPSSTVIPQRVSEGWMDRA